MDHIGKPKQHEVEENKIANASNMLVALMVRAWANMLQDIGSSSPTSNMSHR